MKFPERRQIISREGAKGVEFANYPLINLHVLRVKQMAGYKARRMVDSVHEATEQIEYIVHKQSLARL